MVRKRASFLKLWKDPIHFFRTVAADGAHLVELRFGPRRFYVVNEPELIRDLLIGQAARFEKFPPGNPKQKLFGNGLLTSEGSWHKSQRRTLQASFHRDLLRAYVGQMVASAEAEMRAWENALDLDVGASMNRLTLEVIAKSLFGMDGTGRIAELGECLRQMLSMVNRFVVPWGEWLMRLPLPSSRQYWKSSRRVDEIVAELIREARKNPRSGCLIEILLRAVTEEGTPLSPVEIRDEIITMVIAGHETVAVALTWCLYLLAQHPEIQTSLAEQVDQLLGERPPDMDDFSNVAFLQHVFAESMRLYPPIWILGRRAIENYSFGDFAAPRGSIFLVCMADLHRRCEFFEAPEKFRPERWATPNWPPYAYLPFGAGERRCIGERFAWMEGVFFLACFLRRWRFDLVDDIHPGLDPKLTLNPRVSMRLRIAERPVSVREMRKESF